MDGMKWVWRGVGLWVMVSWIVPMSATTGEAVPAGARAHAMVLGLDAVSGTMAPEGAPVEQRSPGGLEFTVSQNAIQGQFDFTQETSANTCAAECHSGELVAWEESSETDLPPFYIWDDNDELAYALGDMGGLNPYDTTETGNFHSLAWRDYEFQLLYHGQPEVAQPLCQRCHLPGAALDARMNKLVFAPDTRGVDAANADEGITCVSCHLDSSGQINGPEAESGGQGKHAVVASTAFSDGVTLCEGCHNDPVFGSFTRTVDEHLSQTPSIAPDGDGYSCIGCHMDERNGYDGNHAWPGGASPSMRADALEATLPSSLKPSQEFAIIVSNVGAGHNAPTGDTFRAFVLAVEVLDAAGEAIITSETFITPLCNTPVFHEDASYDRVDPIPYGGSSSIGYGTLASGQYTIHAEIQYYQIKPTTLKWVTGAVEIVDAFGFQWVESYDTVLTVAP